MLCKYYAPRGWANVVDYIIDAERRPIENVAVLLALQKMFRDLSVGSNFVDLSNPFEIDTHNKLSIDNAIIHR